MRFRSYVLLIAFLLSAISSFADAVPAVLSEPSIAQSSQILIVETSGKQMFKAKLTAWQKRDHQWEAIFSMDAVIGRNGIASVGAKREGDGKTPSGIFALKRAFGYEASIESKMDYYQVTDEDIWVDDANSNAYNQWVKLNDIKDAKSFEQMKRNDDLYKAAIVIEYNTSFVVPGLGSAIFLHIWRSSDKPTAGCVAVSQEHLFRILKWLDPLANPMIVIQP